MKSIPGLVRAVLGSQFVRSASVLVGGTAIAQFLAVAALPVLTRLYTPDDFSILVQALSTAGLVQTLVDATDITVFAPTNAAFGQLAGDLGFGGDTSDPDAVFNFLVGALTDLAEDVLDEEGKGGRWNHSRSTDLFTGCQGEGL